jgi:hypothetical protein
MGQNPLEPRNRPQDLRQWLSATADTPIIALHRGNTDRLKNHLQGTPSLISRRFTSRDIYPPELGCADDGRTGMHGTPLDGTTLLHLAVEFDEQGIFDLLLAHGADVNARALLDADGFGGHTPLFNSVINMSVACGRLRGASMTRALLARSASADLCATLRKFLDWCETPRWHEAREVTPAEWGHRFPERGWVNLKALRFLEAISRPRSG